MAKAPGFVNFFLKQKWLNTLIRKTIGYVDTPHLSSPPLNDRLSKHAAQKFDLDELRALDENARRKKVLIVQDPFTSFYEAEVIFDLVKLVEKLGYEPILLPFKPNGKPQHVKGFLKEFSKTAESSAAFLNQLVDLGMPLVGVDPSLVLCYRDEYNKTLGTQRGSFEVLLVHEWLKNLSLPQTKNLSPAEFAFFGHCTEKTALPASESQWAKIFNDMGLSLKPVAVGCCGMAGTFGHEASHLDESTGIYKLSWEQALKAYSPQQILASGYSCRSQVARFEGYKPKHPLQALLAQLD
jgi:Fe-S oxidoreductase